MKLWSSKETSQYLPYAGLEKCFRFNLVKAALERARLNRHRTLGENYVAPSSTHTEMAYPFKMRFSLLQIRGKAGLAGVEGLGLASAPPTPLASGEPDSAPSPRLEGLPRSAERPPTPRAAVPPGCKHSPEEDSEQVGGSGVQSNNLAPGPQALGLRLHRLLRRSMNKNEKCLSSISAKTAVPSPLFGGETM